MGSLEMNPTSSAIIHSSSNSITPQIVTPIQIGENTESELIQIDNVIFNNGGGLFTVGTHDFQSNGETGKIYIRTGHPFKFFDTNESSYTCRIIITIYI